MIDGDLIEVVIFTACIEAVLEKNPVGILCKSRYAASQVAKIAGDLINKRLVSFKEKLSIRIQGKTVGFYPIGIKDKALKNYAIPEGMDENGFVGKIGGPNGLYGR